MTLLKKLAAALSVAVLTASAAQATTVLNDWVFNPIGQGYESGQIVNEYLDVNGNVFYQTRRLADGRLAIRKHGVFNVVHADSNGQLFPINYPGGNITGIFDAYAVGKAGGAFTFTGGSVRLYQNPGQFQYATQGGIYGANLGNLIADLAVRPGAGGMLYQDGIPMNDPNVTMITQGRLAEGYFFRSNGEDLSTAPNVRVALSGATSLSMPTGLLTDELACQYAVFTGPGCNGQDFRNTPEHVFLSWNGQFKLTEVPEPGSAALFGVALLGAAAARRRALRKGQTA